MLFQSSRTIRSMLNRGPPLPTIQGCLLLLSRRLQFDLLTVLFIDEGLVLFNHLSLFSVAPTTVVSLSRTIDGGIKSLWTESLELRHSRRCSIPKFSRCEKIHQFIKMPPLKISPIWNTTALIIPAAASLNCSNKSPSLRPSEPKEYKIRILNSQHPDMAKLVHALVQEEKLTWRELNGANMEFRNEFRPRAQYLYFHFCLQISPLSWSYQQKRCHNAEKRTWKNVLEYLIQKSF